MKASDLTEKQLKAAEKYILLRRASGNQATPDGNQRVEIRWEELVMLIAEYGAIRAGSIAKGGSVNEPGDVYLTGKSCAPPEPPSAAPIQRRSSRDVAARSLRPDVRARLDKAIASLNPNTAVSLEDVIASERNRT